MRFASSFTAVGVVLLQSYVRLIDKWGSRSTGVNFFVWTWPWHSRKVVIFPSLWAVLCAVRNEKERTKLAPYGLSLNIVRPCWCLMHVVLYSERQGLIEYAMLPHQRQLLTCPCNMYRNIPKSHNNYNTLVYWRVGTPSRGDKRENVVYVNPAKGIARSRIGVASLARTYGRLIFKPSDILFDLHSLKNFALA